MTAPEGREAAVCANCGHELGEHSPAGHCLFGFNAAVNRYSEGRLARRKCACEAYVQPAPAAPPPAAPPEWTCPVCRCRMLGTSENPPRPWCEGGVYKHARVYYNGYVDPRSAPVAAAPSGARETDDLDREHAEWRKLGDRLAGVIEARQGNAADELQDWLKEHGNRRSVTLSANQMVMLFRVRDELDSLRAALATERATLDRLREKLVAAKSALENWGRHHGWCPRYLAIAFPLPTGELPECNCGYFQAIRDADAASFMTKDWCIAAAEQEARTELAEGER